MTFHASFLTFSLTCIAFSTGAASAGVITVNNANFETLPATGLTIGYSGPGGGAFSETTIPGWVNSGASGQYRPALLADIFSFIPGGGDTFGYSNGPSITQTVGATVATGDVYTLSVYIGNRVDPCCAPTGGAELLVNGTAYKATGTVPANGSWSLFTATYTGLAADEGHAITIALTSTGAQGDFDLVSLSDSGTGADLPHRNPGAC